MRRELELAIRQEKRIIGIKLREVIVTGFITIYQMLDMVGLDPKKAADQTATEIKLGLKYHNRDHGGTMDICEIIFISEESESRFEAVPLLGDTANKNIRPIVVSPMFYYARPINSYDLPDWFPRDEPLDIINPPETKENLLRVGGLFDKLHASGWIECKDKGSEWYSFRFMRSPKLRNRR